MQPDVDDAYLVERARDGYVDAFELLLERHAPMAFRLALRLTGDHHDAQDVAQEALIAAWQNLGRFRGEAAFSTWLYRIVTRRALNKVTRGKATLGTDLLEALPDSAPSPPDRADEVRTHDALAKAIDDLPLPQRVAVVLHHLEGLPYAEVAAVTGSTVPAVRSHLFRARRTLAVTLDEWR